MNLNKNIPYYIIAIVIFIALKFSSRFASFPNLSFLLYPLNEMIEILTGSYSEFIPEQGYFHPKLNILIDKSCSGFNFFLLAFLLFTYLLVKYKKTKLNKSLSLVYSAIIAYFLTLFVNSSRIFVSIIIHSQSIAMLENKQHIVHESIGVITNLSFLILAYFITEKILSKKKKNEELIKS